MQPQRMTIRNKRKPTGRILRITVSGGVVIINVGKNVRKNHRSAKACETGNSGQARQRTPRVTCRNRGADPGSAPRIDTEFPLLFICHILEGFHGAGEVAERVPHQHCGASQPVSAGANGGKKFCKFAGRLRVLQCFAVISIELLKQECITIEKYICKAWPGHGQVKKGVYRFRPVQWIQ
jgi:hypothetical protein